MHQKSFLFEDEEKHWEGMPEFVQEKKEPYSEIIVRFETKEDMQEFSKMIDQKLTRQTQSIWHPKLIWGKGMTLKKAYVNET